MQLLRQPTLLKALAADPDKYLKSLTPIREAHELLEHIPPRDTFHRWRYYMEVNMEEIRSVVSAIYDEKPELDFALLLYETFEGTSDEVEKKKRNFVARHNEEVTSDIKVIPMGNWVHLGDFKKNRDTIDFYNRHTEILKRILDRHEEDKKLGQDLMKKRVSNKKTKNIIEDGRDAEILKQYKSQMTDLAALGARQPLTEQQKRALADAQNDIRAIKEVEDVPSNAIQVNIHTHDTKTGEFNTSSIYTEATQTDEDNVIA
jgi:uncharacterized protein YifE (UPF0438 family)